MAVVASFDGVNRLIYLHVDTVDSSWEPVELYREYRAARAADTTGTGLRRFSSLLKMVGNVPKGGGKATPRYMLLLGGTRIVPYDAAGVTTVEGEILTDDQQSPFDYSTLVNPMIVNVAPADAEIVYVEIESPIQDRLDYGDTLEIKAGEGSGVIHPWGTSAQPVGNYADIRTLADLYNFSDVEQTGTLSQLGADLTDLHIEGSNPERDVLTLNGGSTLGTRLFQLFVTGQANGSALVRDSVVSGLTNFSGILFRTAIAQGGVTVDPTYTGVLQVLHTMSAVAGTGRPVLDVNSANCAVSCRGHIGGLTVSNMNQGNAGSFDILSGTIEFDATCTNGTAVVGGKYQLVDNSGPGFIVIQRDADGDAAGGGGGIDLDHPILRY